MNKPTRTKKPARQSEELASANVVQRTRNHLPITPTAEIAAQSAVRFLHPSHGVGMSLEEYHGAISLILEQACLAIVNHKATASLTFDKTKGRRKVRQFYSSIAGDCWPPAFDLREETEDERFARAVLASH